MATKVFEVAAEKEALVEDTGLTFSFDKKGRVLHVHPPKSGQIALLMARLGRHSSFNDKMAGVIDFFVGILDEADYDYVVNRLLDPQDNLGIEEVQQVMEWLMEEWSGRPTQ
jgi:hypothetical protein